MMNLVGYKLESSLYNDISIILTFLYIFIIIIYI